MTDKESLKDHLHAALMEAYDRGVSDTLQASSAAAEKAITLAQALEREACAKVCEELELKSSDGEWGDYVAGWSDGTDDCAAAIRARGQT